jgi:hypothetical protein
MGMMSLKAEDCIADYSGLDEKQVRALGPNAARRKVHRSINL